ncbi:nuclear pore protein 84/107 [Pholiota molesta]|nr:nuclear pore protein 84/107 [Pholiota molesta]
MSDSDLYAACAEVLSVCQTIKDDLAALLDPHTGFAPRMREICQSHIEEFEDRADITTAPEDIDVLRLEENTWALLQAVMPARKTDPPAGPSAAELLLENPYTPPSDLAQAVFRASPLLSELVVVREWLHDTAPAPAPPGASTGYWPFTKHTVLQAVRTGHAPREGRGGAEMDPDAPSRAGGAALAADDASYEKSLLQALYGYLRAGRLQDAVDACRQAHQPWRAASIRGSLLFQWKALSTQRDEEEDIDNEDPDAGGWSGNRNRALWKSTCIRAALNPALADPERLLYATLAPAPETAPLLKAACRTWEDHLWAELSVLCEARASAALARLAPGSFWEGGLEALPANGAGAKRTLEEEAEEEEEEERPPADHAFHFSQLFIILNRMDRLLHTFAAGLADGSFAPHTFEYDNMTRFYAHFCLFLQMIEVPVPPQAMQTILETYIGILEQAGQRELIALYAGALGDNAVERYAAFLVSLGLSADAHERRLALTRAREHGLDIERVAVVTAERTIEKAFDEMVPRLKGPLPSIIALQPPPTEGELLLLRSIEWTTVMEATYPVALEQATVILRYLLGTYPSSLSPSPPLGAGRVQAAHALLALLPEELAELAEPEEVATEYLHYRQFFVIWDTLARVVAWQAQEQEGGGGTLGLGGGGGREARGAWVAEYRGLIDQAYDQILKLLTTEWLVADVETGGGDRRRRELIRIRQIYVPELILRLHYMLYSSRKVIAENLRRALELANVIADSRYKLYEDFMNDGGRTLAEYLGAVRQAVLAGLENGGSDPFRIVSSV